MHRGAATRFTFGGDAAAVGDDDGFDDREADSEMLIRARLVHAMETFEDERQMLGRNSAAAVGDTDINGIAAMFTISAGASTGARNVIVTYAGGVIKTVINGFTVN